MSVAYRQQGVAAVFVSDDRDVETQRVGVETDSTVVVHKHRVGGMMIGEYL